jgi:hypothetical protein
MSKKKYSARPSSADVVASLMRSRGVSLDPSRLEDRLAAERDRAKREFAAYRDQVETLGSAVKKARRACELAEWAWRQRPNSDTLQAAKQAQATRSSLYSELLEACLQDADLANSLSR